MENTITSSTDKTQEQEAINAIPTKAVTEKAPGTEATKEEAPLKFLMTGKELAALAAPTNRYLLEPFFPSIGTVLIAGQPDTGKSQWARQLAIHVAHGLKDFLGFKLTLKHKRAIYVATEDDCYSCKYLLEQQQAGLGLEPTENISFAFPDGMKLDDLLLKLDASLQVQSADLVVVDSFSDVFNGNDANSNTQMRSVANAFDKLAKKHGCLVLFVHHINKNAYDKKPTQKDIQGGSGLTQKVRCALQLSPDPSGGNKRYLSVSKGNYCPAEFKQKKFELDFDNKTFVFSYKGQQMGLASGNDDQLSQEVLATLKAKFEWTAGVKHTDIWSAISELALCSEATAKRKVLWLRNAGIIAKSKEGKLYHWAENIPDAIIPLDASEDDSDAEEKAVA